ncbi:MAG: GMC family oxidoreductase [Saccharopolyspora sp.]|uniref:GMC family oxidoreductase n=1 Tax=Saccharopolyspora sp. TaxID=33915 RepID=UPI0025F48404|nr:GMC family oxidoreductase [Saccharopolyspora sp.]MBQ6641417.1 GMC family oxidoreductase [Saccharopolyspora sp.]
MGWDLIIVGAGSSGAPLATRCAQRGKRVLLLEAGADYRSAEMPEAWRSPNPGRALLDPAAAAHLLWAGLDATRTDEQPPAPYWRGKGAGGSSAVNGQIAIRPPLEDFDDWALAGWSRDDVLPYFVKLEDDEAYGHLPYHGRGGPTPIYRTPDHEWGAVDAALCRSALDAGYPWAENVNAPGATGVSPYPINSRSGRRVSVNDAYLEANRDSGGLTVRGDALVERLVFAGDRAVGVEVRIDGRAVTEYADEIVLSAGAIHSPAILLRSGIGPGAELRALGIEVRSDLPVGRGLQDHPLALVEIPLTAEATVTDPDARHTNVCVRYASSPTASNDMLLTAMNRNVLSMAGADTGAGAGAFGVWVNQCHSRGLLRLTSLDPEAQPQVQERMLSDERDLARMRDGLRALVELARAPATAKITEDSPDSHNSALFAALDDDRALDRYLLSTVADAQHATSTCRMGGAGDRDAVVDPDCRVLGFDGLRVIDASIFPSVPRANTNLAAIMAGELMADRLR